MYGIPLSRSTWACELKLKIVRQNQETELSRSTWACELKLDTLHLFSRTKSSHAPRERVSWNVDDSSIDAYTDVTLHVSVWVEIQDHQVSRLHFEVTLHVSVWVEIVRAFKEMADDFVTLHVSVWVEILFLPVNFQYQQSRSTWACELKSLRPRARVRT